MPRISPSWSSATASTGQTIDPTSQTGDLEHNGRDYTLRRTHGGEELTSFQTDISSGWTGVQQQPAIASLEATNASATIERLATARDPSASAFSRSSRRGGSGEQITAPRKAGRKRPRGGEERFDQQPTETHGTNDPIKRSRAQRKALNKGFVNADGSADLAGYNRYVCERSARNAGYVTGSIVDLTGYNRYVYEQSARNAGYATGDGIVDLAGYNRHVYERKACKAGFLNRDGSVDRRGYSRYSFERTVRNAGFVNGDGSIDGKSYSRHICERRARDAGFVSNDGDVDLRGYNRHIYERKARNAGFVNEDGSTDFRGYRQCTVERKANNYRGISDNKSFYAKDGSGDGSWFLGASADTTSGRANTLTSEGGSFEYNPLHDALQREACSGIPGSPCADVSSVWTSTEQQPGSVPAASSPALATIGRLDLTGDSPALSSSRSSERSREQVAAAREEARNRLRDGKKRFKQQLAETYGKNDPKTWSQAQRKAYGEGFVNSDGSIDLRGHSHHTFEKRACNYRDASGNYPFLNADGSGNGSLYKAKIKQQRQQDDAITALLILAGALPN